MGVELPDFVEIENGKIILMDDRYKDVTKQFIELINNIRNGNYTEHLGSIFLAMSLALVLAIILIAKNYFVNKANERIIEALKKYKVESEKNQWLTQQIIPEKITEIETLSWEVDIPLHIYKTMSRERIRKQMAHEFANSLISKFSFNIHKEKTLDKMKLKSKIVFIIPKD